MSIEQWKVADQVRARVKRREFQDNMFLGATFPDFAVETTEGTISSFYEWMGDS